jgi:CelD/BcsL family acetyltransferase involved in cellulose biosynthesis
MQEIVRPPAAASHELEVRLSPGFDPVAAGALFEAADGGCVFGHPAWWRAAIDAFGGGRRTIVAEAWRGGQLVGLWPFWEKRLDARELFTRIVEPVGARVSDYVAPLIRAGQDRIGLTSRMLSMVAAGLGAETLLAWPKAHASADPEKVIERVVRERGMLCASLDRGCPVMTLPGSYGEFERRLSKRMRGDVRRQIRRLEAFGPVSLDVAQTREEVGERLDTLIEMHKANWIARRGRSDLEDPAAVAFLRTLAEQLPIESLHVSEVRVAGRPVASHFGFQEAGVLRWYKPAFARDWQVYSPGKVHIALAARAHIADGGREIDFMQGEESYKFEWADQCPLTRSYLLARRTALARWAWNAYIRKFTFEYRT